MDPTRLWFLRHGEVEAPHVGAFIGRSDVALSDLGRHQAEAIRAYLEDAKVDAIVSSPRKRARDTIRPLASALGKIVDVRPAFAEMDFGRWDGMTWNKIMEMEAELAEAWQKDPATIQCPGGESCDIFAKRVATGLEELKEEFKGRSVILAAHAGTNRAVLAHVLRRPYVDCFAFAQDYGCVNAIGWTEAGFGQVALLNFVPGPRAEKQGD